jgi:hypothetical protein
MIKQLLLSGEIGRGQGLSSVNYWNSGLTGSHATKLEWEQIRRIRSSVSAANGEAIREIALQWDRLRLNGRTRDRTRRVASQGQ